MNEMQIREKAISEWYSWGREETDMDLDEFIDEYLRDYYRDKEMSRFYDDDFCY